MDKPVAKKVGPTNCTVFRPEAIDRTPAKRYLVAVDGVFRPDGRTLAPIRYIVEFMSLNEKANMARSSNRE
jgi:hypothetical protein